MENIERFPIGEKDPVGISEEVKFNGRKIKKEKLEEKIKNAESQPGVKVVEVKPNEYKTRIQD